MDKLKHFWTLLFVASALCACDPSDPEAGDEVRMVGGNSFTVEAEDTAVNGGAPIAFVADGEWNASPVGEAKEWLTVTPESGAAGDNEITIACQPNTGGQRDGKVRIVCGESAAEIAIRQKGAGDPGNDPDVPGPPEPVKPLKGQVGRIVFETISESGDFGELGKENFVCNFTYDEEDRISVVNVEGAVVDEYDDFTYTETYRFDRSKPGKIAFSYTSIEPGYEDWSVACDMTLDDAGRVSRLKMQGDGERVAIVSYDDAGRLASVVEEFDVYRDEWHYGWDGGLLATITARGSEDSIGGTLEWSGFEDFTGRYGDLPNGAMNIDPNIFFIRERPDGVFIVMWMLRMMGASSDRLLALSDPMAYSPAVPCPSGLPKPNMTEHCSTEVSYEGYDANIYYDADPDGLVRSITRYCADVVALVEYDIVSGDELVNPEYPELGYAIRDVSEVTLKDIISSQRNGTREEYRFEYRAN